MIKFDRTNYDKLNRINQITFDQHEPICNQCKGMCEQKDNRYFIPIIEMHNDEYDIIWKRCGKGRGKIDCYIDIKQYDDYNKSEQRDKIVKTLTNSKGGYLWGLEGRGKTYLISYIANYLNKRGKDVYYNLSTNIVKSLFNKEIKDSVIKKLLNYEIVFIDDFGSEHLTEWLVREYYMPLIKSRIDNGKPLFISSNYSLDELADRMSSVVDEISINVILDRLHSLGTFKLNDRNYRLGEK